MLTTGWRTGSDENHGSERRKRLHKRIRRLATGLRVVLGLGLLTWVLTRSGLQALAPVLSNAWVLLVLVGLTALGATVEAERLRVLFRASGLNLTWGGAYRVVPVSNFFNFCVPGGTGGDVVKLYYLALDNRRRGVEVATILLVDRVVALAAVLLLVLVMAGANLEVVSANAVLRSLALTFAAGLASIIVVVSLAWSTWLRSTAMYGWVMNRMPLRRYVERMADAVHEFRDRKRVLATAALISLAGHLAVAATFVVVATVVIPAAPWRIVAFLSMMGMVANAIPLTPGGMGVGEAAFEHLFGIMGYAGGALLLVLWRVSMIPLATVGATLYITGHARVRRPGQGGAGASEGMA